jgi:hypothetical protein
VMMRSYRVLERQNILIPTYETKARAKNLKLGLVPIFSTGSLMPIITEQRFFHGLSRVKFWRGGQY